MHDPRAERAIQPARAERVRRQLKIRDGDGTSGGMEARIARLEAHMEHVQAELQKLSTMPVQLAELKVRVDHLPTKGLIVGSAVTTVGAITALLVLLQRVGVLH